MGGALVVTVFGSSRPHEGDADYEEARILGRSGRRCERTRATRLGQWQRDPRFSDFQSAGDVLLRSPGWWHGVPPWPPSFSAMVMPNNACLAISFATSHG